MRREEEGDNGDDDGEDLPEEDCSDGGSCEPEHSGSCPCWEPNSRSAHSLNPDVDYEDDFNIGLDRGRRLRHRHPGVGHSAHARRQDDMRELDGALYSLREAQQLNQVTDTPSKMSLEELQAEAAAYLERWPQGLIARGLPPLDVSDCVTRWDYTMALSRAQHFELSPYEWMRFAFSVAAETGQHIVMRKREGFS